jgi:peptide-methionine (R)-S-oxide reductase
MPTLTDSEITKLKAKLDPVVFQVAFEEGTERAFTHPLYEEKRAGAYRCGVCGEGLFSSEHKYESGSGWPSFYQPAENSAVETKTDHKLRLPRTEVHCTNCGAHLGHVFSDGPPPTGERYCINGTVLDFRPDADEE